ncbi:bifunctional 4-hydroxy-2-oxoglutarate aldolase/2-dehydro-3-deoxy-phosphogluconate aldolase [uncultured Microbacterium sp.]|uniref:bifunctional 4-hydroxy-2-oxoglutarate aldolase/2-dehydro-3-deoxy-phosphogluconate aldolase n=1 Tax=uncultured Microbacterium sp. TaxID=191216 RepID=UPI0035CABC8F
MTVAPPGARQALPDAVAARPVVAVLRATDASLYGPVVDALFDEGVPLIELTMSTPGAIDELTRLRESAPSPAQLGMGTVLTVDDARAAIDAGAGFLVTPTTNVEVISYAVTRGIPIFPGGLTPTELERGWSLGAPAVKLFPASTVGPEYIAHLRGPFPGILVIPSGGIGIEDAAAWLHAGASAVSIGGPLLGDALSGGDLAALRGRARRLRDVVDEALAR